MDITKYYFPDYFEDDNSSILAVHAADLLQHQDKVVKMFEINNQALYGRSPRLTLFLMNYNKKSIFSSSTVGENISSETKPTQGLSTSPKRNQDARSVPRRHLLFNDTEKVSDFRTSEPNTPIRYKGVPVSPNERDEKLLNLTVDKAAESNKQVEISSVSTSSPKGSHQESPSSAEITKMTSGHNPPIEYQTAIVGSREKFNRSLNATVVKAAESEKQFESPTGSTNSPKGSNQESPRSAEIVKMTSNLTVAENRLESPAKVTGNNESGKNYSPRSAVINKITFSPIGNNEKSSYVLQSAGVSANEKIEKTSNPTVNKTAENDKQVEGASVSTLSLKGSNQESPRSAEITKMTSKLTIAETQFESPLKMTEDIVSSKQESLQSEVLSETTSNLKANTEETKSVQEYLAAGLSFHRAFSHDHFKSTEKSDDPNSVYKDSVCQIGVITKASPSIVVTNETPSPIKKYKLWRPFIVSDQELTVKLETADSSPKDTSPIQIDKINLSPNEAGTRLAGDSRKRKSNSPKKGDVNIFRSMPRVTKKCGEAEINVEVPLSLEKNVGNFLSTSQSSPADYRSDALEVKSRVVGETKTYSPLKKFLVRYSESSEQVISATSSQGASESSPVSDALEVKSPVVVETKTYSPLKKFLVRYSESSEQVISATSSQGASESSPVSGEAKIDSSLIIPQQFSSPSEKFVFAKYSGDATEQDSSVNGEDIFNAREPSNSPSLEEGAEDLEIFDSGSSETEIGAFNLNNSLLKFNTLLELRKEFLSKVFSSILDFKSFLEFLSSYVKKAKYIVTTIQVQINEYSAEELKDSVDSATAIVTKLEKKLIPWTKDLNSEINIWYDSFDSIRQVKAKYEPILSNEGEPNLSVEDLQAYERKMKGIWRILDDMILMSDSRRSLFSYISYDIVCLIRNVVECLILVGILLPR